MFFNGLKNRYKEADAALKKRFWIEYILIGCVIIIALVALICNVTPKINTVHDVLVGIIFGAIVILDYLLIFPLNFWSVSPIRNDMTEKKLITLLKQQSRKNNNNEG